MNEIAAVIGVTFTIASTVIGCTWYLSAKISAIAASLADHDRRLVALERERKSPCTAHL